MAEKSQYKSLSEWCKASPRYYQLAAERGILKDIADHFGWKFSEKRKNCTIDELLISASKYDSYTSWRKNNVSLYRLATRFKLTEELCEKMNWKKRLPNGYWTREKCLSQARKFKTVADWSRGCSGSRSSAQDNGWVQECSAHMTYEVRPDGYWTKEKVLVEARKYDTKKEWRASCKGSFRKAQDNKKLYEEAVAHMTPLKKPSNYWNEETCMENAKKYKTKKDWYKGNVYAFQLSQKKGWYKECTEHMK